MIADVPSLGEIAARDVRRPPDAHCDLERCAWGCACNSQSSGLLTKTEKMYLVCPRPGKPYRKPYRTSNIAHSNSLLHLEPYRTWVLSASSSGTIDAPLRDCGAEIAWPRLTWSRYCPATLCQKIVCFEHVETC